MNIKKLINYQVLLVAILFLLIIFFGIYTNGTMVKPSVLFGLTATVVEIGLMALPLTYIIITGGIDLSVGSIMALTGITFGATYEATNNIYLSGLVAMFVGILAGGFNGLIIAKTKIPPLVTTLATFSLFYGIARIISGTKMYSNFPKGFKFLAYNNFLGVIPYQFILFIIFTIIFAVAFAKTPLGMYLRGMGFNEDTVHFSGVNVGKLKISIYILSGFMSTVACFVYLSRLPTAQPDMGINLNIEAITAVVLGGTSIMGGKGSISGTFISVLILGVLKKGLQLVGYGGDIFNFVLGIVLICCLIGFAITEKNKR